MSRPKPTVLLDYTDPKTYKSEQVLVSDGIYAVFFEGKPINVRNIQKLTDKPPQYRKVSFSNHAHAFNLCEKLNKMFKTTSFTVVKFTIGTPVTEDEF